MLFRSLLKYVVRKGTIDLIDARGRRFTFGDGKAPRATIRFHNRLLDYKLVFNPPLYLGEAYMDDQLTVEEGSLDGFIEILASNYHHLENHWFVSLVQNLTNQGRWLKQYNPMPRARANVAHHYDLSGALYDLFLDSDRQYSCGYFTDSNDSLEQAQLNKKRHIAAKLLLDRPGLKLLDIGSGWGGLGLYLAQVGNCEVAGVTLSTEQHKVSQERAKKAKLDQRVRFDLRDYRKVTGTFDRIVSVGMFEHVGKKHYHEFFKKVRELLADDGVCLLHSIARFDDPSPINPFIRKYIFPGADIPTLAEVLPAIENNRLLATDIEILRLHYAETLRHWRERFDANRDKIAALYDERFCRMWEVYLIACEMGFKHVGLMVFQIQITKNQNVLPLTRDYMVDWERDHAVEQSEAAE